MKYFAFFLVIILTLTTAESALRKDAYMPDQPHPSDPDYPKFPKKDKLKKLIKKAIKNPVKARKFLSPLSIAGGIAFDGLMDGIDKIIEQGREAPKKQSDNSEEPQNKEFPIYYYFDRKEFATTNELKDYIIKIYLPKNHLKLTRTKEGLYYQNLSLDYTKSHENVGNKGFGHFVFTVNNGNKGSDYDNDVGGWFSSYWGFIAYKGEKDIQTAKMNDEIAEAEKQKQIDEAIDKLADEYAKALPDVDPEQEPQAEPEPQLDPKPDPQAEPEPEPQLDPKPDPQAEPEPEPQLDPAENPKSEPKPKPKPRPKPKPDPEQEPQAEPEQDPAESPKSEPKPKPKPRPKPKPDPKQDSEQDSQAEPEPKFELPAFCDWATYVCEKPTLEDSKLPEKDIDYKDPSAFDKSYVNFSHECPSFSKVIPVGFSSFTLSFDFSAFCAFLAKYVKPVIIFLAYLRAAFYIASGIKIE